MPIKIAKKSPITTTATKKSTTVEPSDLLTFDLDDSSLISPIVEEIDTKSDPVINLVLATSKSIIITDQESLSYAAKFVQKVIRKIIARIKAKHDPNIENWKKGLADAKSEKKALTDPLEQAEKIIEDKIKSYQIALEKEREEQRLLEAKLHEEKSKAEFEAQVSTLLESGDLENLKEAQELIKEKLELEESGEEYSNSSSRIFAPSNVKTEKVEGMSTKKRLKFKIVDASKIPRKFMIPDERAIREIVKISGKDAEKLIPGIEVYSENQLSFYKD